MIRYRNVQHGRIIERLHEDEWLERSAGWERLEDAPAPEASTDEQNEGSNE